MKHDYLILNDKRNPFDIRVHLYCLTETLRGHPLSTYAPRGREGGGPKAYVVREVA